MTDSDRTRHDADDEIRIDVMKTIYSHGRMVLIVTGIVTAVVALVALTYFLWLQPTVRVYALEFRPVFLGAAAGKYPNDLPFAPSDVTASLVIDEVFDTNQIQQYCDRSAFKSAFFVEQQSTEYGFLEAEFQARLADTRLTAVDRERLQEEYASRRAALPLRYRLVFAMPEPCQEIPNVVVTKSLNDVLSTWAQQSEGRRGVLNLQVQILTPNVLDVGLASEGSRLIRADLIRSALRRLVTNVRLVETKPGASLVRSGENRTTFAELRGRFEDLIQSRLEPLVVMAGRGLGAESLAWVQEALAAASQEQAVAEGKARAYLSALREYSGVPQMDRAGLEARAPSSGDVQTLTPQIDRTFIDRILEMSEGNTVFRQDLTRDMVEADVEAVESRAKVGYYEHLAAALRRPEGAGLTGEIVDAKLQEIINDGKALAEQFNALYLEWSRVSLRPAAAMYQADRPISSTTSRPFSRTELLMTVVATFLTALLTSIAIFAGRDRYIQWRTKMVVTPSP